ncbi:MAG: XrtA/PEP-CTERM system TPR-repeat protein PrsT [Hyphomonadaceae bacterium]
MRKKEKGLMQYSGEARQLARGALIAAMVVVFAGFGQPGDRLSGGWISGAWASDGQAHLDRAKTYVSKGDFSAAEIELRNAKHEAPNDANIRALLAQVYLRLSNLPNAEREARAARDLNAPEADYLMTLAEALLRQQKFADIPAEIKSGDRAPELESKVRIVLGLAANAMNDPAKAEALLREAAALDPNSTPAKLNLAKSLMKGKPVEAEKIIDDMLAAEPKSAEAITLKGEILATHGNADGAIQRFGEALALDPGNISARLARATVYLNRGNYDALDRDLMAVSKASPQDFRANYLWSLRAIKKQDFVAADRILEWISPGFWNFPQGFYLQALAKYRLQQYGQASDAIAKYVARVPNNPAGARLAATIAVARGNSSAAIDYLTSYLNKSPPDTAMLVLLGKLYADSDKPALALEQFQKAAALAPDGLSLKAMMTASTIDASAKSQGLEELEDLFVTSAGEAVTGPLLVLNELRAGRLDKAAAMAEKLIAEKPDLDFYQVLLGLVRTAQKDFPTATKIFEGLVMRNPDSAPARKNLAQVYLAAGRADNAKKTYEDFLSRKPNDPTALLALTDIAARDGKWDEAIGYAEKARTAARLDPAPGIKLLELYAARQDWTRAKALAGELVLLYPGNAVVAEARERIQAASGGRNAAIESYR